MARAQKTKKPASRRPQQAVTPHLICAGAAKAIAFYKKAFGATEMMRLPWKDGKLMHASIQIGNGVIMLAEEEPSWGSRSPLMLKGTPVTIHLNVPDVDKFFARAVRAGAKVVMPVGDMFWGDRYGMLEDPFGHRWSIATHQRDLSLDEIKVGMKEAMARHQTKA